MDDVSAGRGGVGGADGEVQAVGAVTHDGEGRLLVVRRGREPARGLWSLPGGRLEPDEDDARALVREVAEETGLRVRIGALLGTVRFPSGDGRTIVVRDYRCTLADPSATAPVAGDDAVDAAWVTSSQLRALPTTHRLIEILTSWNAMPS